MAKSSKTAVKRATKADNIKDDKVIDNAPKNAIEAESEPKNFKLKAKIDFYDLKHEKPRRIGAEWDEDDAVRAKDLENRGFVTVL